MADKHGFQTVQTRAQRKKGKGKKKVAESEVEQLSENGSIKDNATDNVEESGEQNEENTAIPGTSGEISDQTNIQSDSASVQDMARGTASEDTSDIDSDTLARQEEELRELERQVAEKAKKRSNKEKRERKARLFKIRKQAEERKRQLQRDSLEDEITLPAKRKRSKSPVKVPKSRNGKGVKSSGNVQKRTKDNGKKLDNHGKRDHSTGKNKLKRSREISLSGARARKNSRAKLNTDSSSGESCEDEFEEVIEKAKRKTKRVKKAKVKQGRQDKKCLVNDVVGRKRSHREASDSSQDSSSDSYTSSGSSTSTDSSVSEAEYKRRAHRKKSRKGKKRGKSIKSGVKAKAHKIRLKTSELCAQAVLDEEHYPGNYELDELSFDQLVAGELEICTMTDISKQEKNSRLNILKLLAYFANSLPQSAILDVYKAVILKVEKGLFAWSSELVSKVESMLDRAVSRMRTSKGTKSDSTNKENGENAKNKKELGILTKQGEKIIYCLDYNRGQCDKTSSHKGKFAGKEVVKQHVCKVCLATDKEQRSHKEGDEVCPNKR